MRRFLNPRYLVPLPLAFFLLVGSAWDAHYHVMGWWRGDACFRGRPTCYWENVITMSLEPRPKSSEFVRALKKLLRPVGIRLRDAEGPEILNGHDEAIPVLGELLAGASDANVRQVAAQHLGHFADRDDVLELLEGALTDESTAVRCVATFRLWEASRPVDDLMPDAIAVMDDGISLAVLSRALTRRADESHLPLVCELLKHREPRVRVEGVFRVAAAERLRPENGEKIKEVLRPLQSDPDIDVAVLARSMHDSIGRGPPPAGGAPLMR